MQEQLHRDHQHRLQEDVHLEEEDRVEQVHPHLLHRQQRRPGRRGHEGRHHPVPPHQPRVQELVPRAAGHVGGGPEQQRHPRGRHPGEPRDGGRGPPQRGHQAVRGRAVGRLQELREGDAAECEQ